MATDISANYTGNFNVPGEPLENQVYVLGRYFDCTVTGLTGTTNYKFATAPAGAVPIGVIVTVATAEGGAATLDVGDSSSATRFETDADLNSAATTATIPCDATTMYAADTDLWITPSATLDAAKFYVGLLYIMFDTEMIGSSVV